MDLQNLINSPIGVGLGLTVCRLLPPFAGYKLANFLSDRLADAKGSPMVSVVRANQQVIHQGQLDEAQLHEITRATFRNTARCQYDLYHNLHNLQAARRLVQFSPAARHLLDNMKSHQKGLMVVGIHLSNFDFVLQALGLQGVPFLALGLPRMGRGYRWQNKLRVKAGVEIIESTPAAVRYAVRHLQNGGTVATGIDRPVANCKIMPRFFGHPASLPTHHIHLALLAKIPIVLAAVITRPDSVYEMVASEPIQMESRSSHQEEILFNAERVLNYAEGLIRKAPEQWSMFFPVWPNEKG
jgi:KDO2-lipid IV(A) lauroyltransferase